MRLGLWTIPFSRFQRVLARFNASSGSKRHAALPTIVQLVLEVRIVSNYVPHATCLTQALAGPVLLARYGYPAVVHVGVAKPETDMKSFQSHAWLESDGQVIIGASEQPYVALVTF